MLLVQSIIPAIKVVDAAFEAQLLQSRTLEENGFHLAIINALS